MHGSPLIVTTGLVAKDFQRQEQLLFGTVKEMEIKIEIEIETEVAAGIK